MARSTAPLVFASVLACFVHATVSDARNATAGPGRVADRRAIEEVYWSHRIWPAVNRAPKPELSAILPDSVLSERITDHLSKLAALERFWGRRITAAQVQAELDRMATHTRAPRVLAELFGALHNDPQRIAAALAEPSLVDRLIRSWYAGDGRFHEAVKHRAERSLARPDAVADLRAMDGEFVEAEYFRSDAAAPAPFGEDGSLDDGASGAALDATAWEGLLGRLATAFDAAGAARERPDVLPRRITSRLVEEADAFRVYRVLEAGSERVRIQSVAWPKRAFDDWWREARVGLTPVTSPDVAGHYTLPALAGACVDDTWAPMAAESPYGRANHTAVWTGTEMIIWGGRSTALGWLGDGWRYNPVTDTWLPIAIDLHTPSARTGHTAVWSGTDMIVWGGSFGNSAVAMPLGGRYDPQTDSWAAVRDDATSPAARLNHAAVWTGTEMIVWGGLAPQPCPCAYLNTGGRYNPVSDSWTPTRADLTAPEPRSSPTAVWTGSEMIVWGGYKKNPFATPSVVDVNTGGRYDPLTDSWTLIQGSTGRSEHSAVWTGTWMIVWGGLFRTFQQLPPPQRDVTTLINTGSRYNPVTNTWASTSVTPVTPTPRSGHTAIWSGNRMVVWGGSAGAGAQYDPGPDEWTPVRADATAPAGATGNTAVWTGTEMIVWGGSERNNGGRYDPAQDTWVPTAVEGAFPGGAKPEGTGVWTGSEFIVWRGPGLAGRYNPATDQWASVTSAGSPPARTVNTAVWTGSEMIVWGGLSDLGFNPMSGGGAYDPTLNHWTSIGSGGLSARSSHTAVWTGTEMIVWGGYACCTYQATGARYNPATQTWSPTRADATTPTGRAYHSAVWTGSEMIVWGGGGGAGNLNSGGRYDPAADTWTPTPVDASGPSATSAPAVWTGSEMITWNGLEGWAYSPSMGTWREIRNDATAPEPRRLYGLVWTGHEMIVWGGERLGTPSPRINTGGRYEPVGDTWTPTLTDGSTPSPRANATAVWAGDVMLVWGGAGPTGGGPVLTGGAYCAVACQLVTWYFDGDGDGHGDETLPYVGCTAPLNYAPTAGDCNDLEAAVWATPEEARDLTFAGTQDLAWSPPDAPGATALVYDLVRSSDPANFAAAGVCVGAGIVATSATDPEAPIEGQVFYYLVRAVNGCAEGAGILGTSSDGTPVAGPSCP